jgi:hypothetical protein
MCLAQLEEKHGNELIPAIEALISFGRMRLFHKYLKMYLEIEIEFDSKYRKIF